MEKKLLLKLTFLGTLFLFGIAFLPYGTKVQSSSNEDLMYVHDEITIKFKEHVGAISIVVKDSVITTGIVSVDSLNRKYKVIIMYKLFPGEVPPVPGSVFRDLSLYYNLRFAKVPDLDFVVKEYAQNSYIEIAERIPICPVDAIPNDPEFSQQWGLHQASDKDIDAPEAWDITKGNSSILLAIVDTGVDWNHPDLAGSSPYTNGNIWINWTEWNGTSGVDDDGNGYVDDIRGWDWVTGVSGSDPEDSAPGEDGETEDNNPMDFHGHGTHVAGIAAAMTNNSTRVSGVAGGWYTSQRGCQIMTLRAGWKSNDGLGRVRMDFCASAINYAKVKGATVINCSWGSSYFSALKTVVDNAISAGIIVVKSAGNNNSETADYLNGRGDCISVAATDQNDTKWSSSNYGTWVDVSAPGVNIRSTLFDNTADYLSGTSMSAAFVTGLVGLVKSSNSSLNRNQITSTIILSADNIDAQNPNYIGKLGSGRINANKSVRNLYVPQVYTTISSALNAAISGKTVIVSAGTYTENNNFTVTSGITLQFNPGVTLKMANGKKLTINGTLSAQGTSGNRITFQSISGTWYGIEFNHAASGSQVKYCNIKDAQYGIYMIHTDAVITGNIIEENTTGLLFEDYADGDGIINQNIVTFNSSYGIRCKTYSDPLLFSCNVISDNGSGFGNYGVYGDASSVFDLGRYSDQGHNSIYYNLLYEVYSSYSGTIYARYNWWGDSDPDPFVSDNVDWSYYLNSDPNTMLAKSISENPSSDAPIMKAIASTDTIGISEVDYAYLIYRKEDYQTAASLFETIVHKYPNYFSGRRALAFLYKCNKHLDRASDNIVLLDNISASYTNEEIDALAKNIAAGELIKQGDYQAAIVRSEAVTSCFAKTEYAKQALFNLGSIYWYFLNDPKIGESYYRQLIAAYPEDDLSISALATLGEWQPDEPKPEQQPLAENPEQAEFSLKQNYPNPFNPETTIRYHLAEASQVTIKIYNLLGAEVITLVDETQLQGAHAIQWNGRDRFGNAVANGVYWLRLQAGKFVGQRKLVVLR